MKTIFYALAAVLCLPASAQQAAYQKTWITGVNVHTMTFGQSGLPALALQPAPPPTYARFVLGYSSICDSTGQLTLASDGYRIYNKNLTLLDGGDTLVLPDLCKLHDGSTLYAQSSLFLPVGSGKYYFLNNDVSQQYFDSFWKPGAVIYNAFPDQLSYSVVDMKANGGAGKVVKRAQKILIDTLLSNSQMTACRHGNGRDWWLFKQAHVVNKVYKFRLTPDSVLGPYVQSFAQPQFSPYDHGGQNVFSKDGTRYATTCRGTGKIFVADFDRCTGNLSNPKVYNVTPLPAHDPNNPSLTDPWTEGLAFSPNGRFLYVAQYYNIQQLDLQDNNASTQWATVAGLDTAWNWFQSYSSLYLGPDDRLYVGNWGGLTNKMSLFNTPNGKGAASGFCARCLVFPGVGIHATPTVTNYALGAKTPPCGSTGIAEAEASEPGFEVYPNPASDYITVRYAAPGTFLLTDVAGREVVRALLPAPGTSQKIKLPNLAPGVYGACLLADDGQHTVRMKVAIR